MITVTNNNDSGAGSFRAALAAAIAGEQITFAITGTITMVNGKYLINKNLIITGPGSGSLTFDAGTASRIFDITTGVVTITGLTLINGSDPGNGGGIKNQATLTLSDVVVSSCSAANGGGIWNSSSITMTDCSVSGCAASAGDGGGILNTGTITATNLPITTCTSSGDGAGVWTDGTFTHTGGSVMGCVASGAIGGGGVSNSGTYTPTEVTIGGNTASSNGGGIHNIFGTVTVTRCTISTNTNIGIYNDQGTVTVDNSTVSGNTITGIINSVGSIDISHSTIVQNVYGVSQDSGSLLTLYDTILAGNATADYDGDTADVISNGHNILGVNSNPVTLGAGDQSVLTYAALVVGPLQNNGGPTSTHALLSGSPAIDAGDNTAAPATDQRGDPRVVNGTIDIGAYESAAVVPPIPPVPPLPPLPPIPPAPPRTGLKPCLTPIPDCGFLATLADDSQPGVPNLSSEAPDVDLGVAIPNPPPWVHPPLQGGDLIGNETYTGAQPCVTVRRGGTGFLFVGGQVVATCGPTIPPPPGGQTPNPDWKTPPDQPPEPPTPRILFPNQPQTCTSACPDGTSFSYTTPAATFFASTVVLANEMALTYACKAAVFNKICFNGSSKTVCAGGTYLVDVVPFMPSPRPLTWSINGTLPPGLSLTQAALGTSATVSGIPNVGGDYTFELVATDQNGMAAQRQFALSVVQILTDLPNPTVGVAYSQQLISTGGASSSTYSVVAGTIPAGLTLSSTGLVSGTPTTALGYDFTIAVNRAGLTCLKRYFLTVQAAPEPPIWSDGTATLYNDQGLGFGTVDIQTMVATATTITSRLKGHTAPALGELSMINCIVIPYSGHGRTFRIDVSWSTTPGFVLGAWTLNLGIRGCPGGFVCTDPFYSLVQAGDPDMPGTGTFHFNLTVPDLSASPNDIAFWFEAGMSFSNLTMDVQVTLTNL